MLGEAESYAAWRRLVDTQAMSAAWRLAQRALADLATVVLERERVREDRWDDVIADALYPSDRPTPGTAERSAAVQGDDARVVRGGEWCSVR